MYFQKSKSMAIHKFIHNLALVLGFVASISASAQSLQEINTKFQIDPKEPVRAIMRPVRNNDQWVVHFEITTSDTTNLISNYHLQFEIRHDLSEKTGIPVSADQINQAIQGNIKSGKITIPRNSGVEYLIMRAANNISKKILIYYTTLFPEYPLNVLATNESGVITERFTRPGVFKLTKNATFIVSYYSADFPPAAPAFAESLAAVPKAIIADSNFTILPEANLGLYKEGLYLIQEDTMRIEGLGLLIKKNYPKVTTIQDLGGPLIYICTKEEYNSIKNSPGDKRVFDRTVLSITGDKERAKTFIRSYFNRVEQANILFTSYKEGWKTDRGMIYIIFGLPETLLRFTDREVWSYSTLDGKKLQFEFVRSSTVFDPDNVVLLRKESYAEYWYTMVDLWRNARF